MGVTQGIVKDNDGNVICCYHCGSRNIHKSGFLYRANSKKQQWKCLACGKKTVRPTILEKSPFKVEERDPESIPIEELIEFRKKQYRQKKTSKDWY